MIPSRQAPDLLAGHWLLLPRLGRVPQALVWDNESAVGSWRGGKPKLTEAMKAFRGTLGIRVIQCRPADPEAKGMVERANGYLETSFLPGRGFTAPADFNAQLAGWLERANQRQHRRLGCRPPTGWAPTGRRCGAAAGRAGDWLATDRCGCPGTTTCGWTRNDYSVHPGVGRPARRGHRRPGRVVVTCAGVEVAAHARCWAGTRASPTRLTRAAAAELRQARRLAPPAGRRRGRAPGPGRLRPAVRPGRRRSRDRLMATTNTTARPAAATSPANSPT